MAFTPSHRRHKPIKVADHFSTIGRHKTSSIGKDFKIDKLGTILNELKKRGGDTRQRKSSFFYSFKGS